jgi:amino acid adenylation domain-containing protein
MSIASKPSNELSIEEKRALAERLLREKARRPKSFPLSFAQLRLWLLDQLDPESAAYNLHGAVRMRGLLDVAALEQSLNAIVQRHEVLRTTFALVDGQPMQLIAPAQPLALSRYDLQAVAAEAQRAEMQQLLNARAQQAFDLTRGPLLHTALVRLGPQDHILSLTLHHIVGDAWSVGVFVRELAECYTAFAQGRTPTLAPLPIQYVDFALWQRQLLESDGVLATQLGYWKERLAGAPPLELPTDYPRPARPDFGGAQEFLTLPTALVAALKELSQREHVTLFMTLLAAFQLLLARWTGQQDVMIGSPIANRNQIEIEGLIGFFVNVLVLRSDLAGNPSFRALARRVRAVCMGAYAHQDLPFEKLVEELQPERAPGRNPLFEIVLDYINTPQPSFELPGLAISAEPTEVVSKYALTLYVNEYEGDITLRLLYQRALYSAERMACFLRQLAFLLEQIVAAPERLIDDYSLVTPADAPVLPDPRAALPEPFYPALPQQFAAWVAQTPQQPALRQGARMWTYAELAERVAELAQTLLAQGLLPGERVAVLGVRSFGLIAAMLAVFASRGVLLMSDPSLPIKRQRLMLEQAGARRLLYVASSPPLQDALLELPAHAVTMVDAQTGRPDGHSPLAGQPVIALPPPAPNDPAYIFFTSGTSGIPKGVLGRHKGLAHFLTWQRTTFAVGPQDRCAQLTALSFDVVLRDICLPLTSGATLCLPDDLDDLGPDRLWPWLEREAITIMHSVPALAQAWLDQIPAGIALPALRLVFFAGEPLPETLVRRWRTAFPAPGQIVNLYGPTETTLAKCAYLLPDRLTPGIQPVGWPLPETQALVLNQGDQLCGLSELGQIVIRTPFRTHGYINADAEQQRAFVQNPFRDDAQDILYYTGDRGRYRLDGALEVLGRLDQQVKIRGVRIELDEVTAALRAHAAASACVVVARQNAQGQPFLVAYVVPTSDERRRTIDETAPSSFVVRPSSLIVELRAFLAERLPDSMIPSAFVLLDALPLTPNGKLDRRALPPPESDAPASAATAVAPRTPLEEVLVGIWAELLEKEQFGIHDNFFDLGGHSLLATQLIARLRDAFQLKLRLRGFYEAPTVAGLAELMLQDPAQRERIEQTAQMLLTLSQLSDEEVAAMLE